MLGLRRGAVQLVPYTPTWVILFQSERARLQHALGADALDIQPTPQRKPHLSNASLRQQHTLTLPSNHHARIMFGLLLTRAAEPAGKTPWCECR
jgi:hypothetical protein